MGTDQWRRALALRDHELSEASTTDVLPPKLSLLSLSWIVLLTTLGVCAAFTHTVVCIIPVNCCRVSAARSSFFSLELTHLARSLHVIPAFQPQTAQHRSTSFSTIAMTISWGERDRERINMTERACSHSLHAFGFAGVKIISVHSSHLLFHTES